MAQRGKRKGAWLEGEKKGACPTGGVGGAAVERLAGHLEEGVEGRAVGRRFDAAAAERRRRRLLGRRRRRRRRRRAERRQRLLPVPGPWKNIRVIDTSQKNR